VKLYLTSGEAYPVLFVGEPADDYERERAYEVPDGLAQAFLTAQVALHEAEQAILRHLLDARLVPRTADIIDDHLDEGTAA
jgi:predicted HAD superfamily phosphohydrolase